MKNFIKNCPKCNRDFHGKDEADCDSMISAHLEFNCEREKKNYDECMKFFKEVDERSKNSV